MAIKFLLLIFMHFLIIFAPSSVVHGATTSPCNQTPYPDICNSFMASTKLLKPLHKTPFITLRDSVLSATLAQAEQAHRLISVMDVSSFDERAKSAWADCVELYEDSVYQLKRSVGTFNPDNNVDNVQTWLSAALTNHQTCQDGFIDFNLASYLQLSPFMLSDFSKLLSNSLAINMATTSLASAHQKPKGHRRLLAHADFPEWMAVADRKLLQAATTPKPDLVVAKDGSGDYMTISEAVNASAKRMSGNKRFVIYVKRGVYTENVVIKRSIKNLMLIGDGIEATIVTSNRNFKDGYTTFRSATFAVSGERFIARDMTFENTAGPQNHQAVAFRGDSDLSAFYSCSFKGYQDTLYIHSSRQFYRNCDIYGTVDFICGNAAAVLQNCNIYVRKPMTNQMNTITAQKRIEPSQTTGIVIHNSRVTAASDLKPVQGSFRTYLGRPWKEYSRTVFMKTFLDGLIDPAGWAPWNGDFALKTLYYAEYMNYGSGAGTGGRVKWPGYHVLTSATEAVKFSVGNFLDGDYWLASTGVPFSSGL